MYTVRVSTFVFKTPPLTVSLDPRNENYVSYFVQPLALRFLVGTWYSVNFVHLFLAMSHALAFKKNLQRLTRTVHETVDKTTTKTQELSPELVEVEENVQKLKTVYTAALKKATESLVSIICVNSCKGMRNNK